MSDVRFADSGGWGMVVWVCDACGATGTGQPFAARKDAAEHTCPGWLRRKIARAKARIAKVPKGARPVVLDKPTTPISGDGHPIN